MCGYGIKEFMKYEIFPKEFDPSAEMNRIEYRLCKCF